MAFGKPKFAIRVQMRDASSKKPRRVSLVSQRRITVNGAVVKPGAKTKSKGSGQIAKVIAKKKPAAKTAKVKRSVRK